MRIGREEIFGPVMSVMIWDDYEEMLRKVNGVEYGLTAAIVTNDLAKAMETAERDRGRLRLDQFEWPLHRRALWRLETKRYRRRRMLR